MTQEAQMRSLAFAKYAVGGKGSTVLPVKDSKTSGGDTMKKYRVREGSIADYARMFGVGALFWGLILAMAIQNYPM